MKIERAPDVETVVRDIVESLEIEYIDKERLICMRSFDSQANAYARIWSLPQMWQKALDIRTFYVIEVLSQHYDKLNSEEQEKVIIHELLHIPKTFSGALVPHNFQWRKITKKEVDRIHKEYQKMKNSKKE